MESRLDQTFEELIGHIEADPAFDTESFIAAHSEDADRLREKLRKLRDLGLLVEPARGSEALRKYRGRLQQRTPPAGDDGSPPTIVSGRLIGDRYRPFEEIGRGGMGSVVRAFDANLQREVAMKIAPAPQETLEGSTGYSTRIERFLAEAHVMGQLEHPGIVPVHDVGVTPEDRVYFTMKLVRGRSLREVVEALAAGDVETREEFTLPRRIQIIQRVCEALSFAHTRGIVHRDLKPGNVMIGRFGEVQLMDWGLAKLMDEPCEERTDKDALEAEAEGDWSVTASGDILGTPSYMSPEQARGDWQQIDSRTDVFGVGALLVHFMGGAPPYRGQSRREVLERARMGRRNDPGLAHAASPVPREIVAICRKALMVDRAGRYSSVVELSEDLQAVIEGRAGMAWSDNPFSRFTKWVRRHPTTSAVAIAVLIIAILGQSGISQAQELFRVRLLKEDLALAADLRQQRLRAFAQSVNSGADACSRANWMLDVLADHGLSLEVPAATDELPGRILSMARRNPVNSEVVVSCLYDMLINCARGRIYAASAYVAQEPLSPLMQKRITNVIEIANREPRLARVWPTILEVLRRGDQDEWRQDLLERLVASLATGVDELGPLITASRSSETADDHLVLLARIMRETGRAEEADEVCRTLTDVNHAAVGLASDRYYAQAEIAKAAFKNGEFGEAIRRDLMAMAIEPRAISPVINLTAAFHSNRELEDALTMGHAALRLAPDNYRSYYNTALVLLDYQARDWGEAVDEMAVWCFEEALRLNPDHVPAMFGLAQSLHYASRFAEADEYFERALEEASEGERRSAYLNSCWSLEERQLFDRALELYVCAADTVPGFWEAYLQIGEILGRKGMLERGYVALVTGNRTRVEQGIGPYGPATKRISDWEEILPVLCGIEPPVDAAAKEALFRLSSDREQYQRAAELAFELLPESDSLAQTTFSFLRDAARAAANASAGRGFVFEPGDALLEPCDGPPLNQNGVPYAERALHPADQIPLSTSLSKELALEYGQWSVDWLAMCLAKLGQEAPALDEKTLQSMVASIEGDESLHGILEQNETLHQEFGSLARR